MVADHIRSQLQASINDYHHWLTTQVKKYHATKDYGELRGIFFNKLVTRLREAGVPFTTSRWHGRILVPEDLVCILQPQLLSISNLIVIPHSHHIFAERATLLELLRRFAEEAIYDHFPQKPEYEIKAVVSNFKSYKV